jgi:2-polyprenyl-6-methoxyphenol hydroxylase-like FAD-dependent oxidoreductase
VPGPSRTDVLVVGAGPTGLLAALQLAERGVRVELIEEEWRAAGHSYALALHSRSLSRLAEVGLAEEAIAAGQKLEALTLFEGHEPRLTVRLAPAAARFPFALALPQSVLEELLANRLKAKGVNVRWSHRLAGLQQRGDGVVATVQRLEKESTGYAVARTEWAVARELELEASFVIGADGHGSLVRRALGVPLEEAGSSQAFAVFECDAGGSPVDELRLVLQPSSTSALWPLPGGRARWSLELEAPAVSAADRHKSRLTTQLGERFFHHLDEDAVGDLLRERAPWFPPEPGDLGWSIEVRFERRLASSFGSGRVWLAGDAAHLTGPAGMQSMNAGLDEASELAALLERIERGNGGLELLAGYGRERLAQWRFLLGRAGRLRTGPETTAFVARNAERLLACLPATGEDLVALAAEAGLTAERG